MDAFGIASEDRRLVDDDLRQTARRNRLERGCSGHVRRNPDLSASCGGVLVAGEKLIAALSLAFDGKFGGGRARERPRHFEQPRPVASLELKLRLAKRQRAVAGVDFAAIDGQCDVAVLASERIGCTLDPGFEHGAQLLAQFF